MGSILSLCQPCPDRAILASEGHNVSEKDVIFSSPLLFQTCHTISFGYVDKEDFEHSLRFEALGRLKSLYTKGISSRPASYMEGKFSGI